jgi:hypothetical protein
MNKVIIVGPGQSEFFRMITSSKGMQPYLEDVKTICISMVKASEPMKLELDKLMLSNPIVIPTKFKHRLPRKAKKLLKKKNLL